MWLLTAIQKAQPSTDAATGMPSHRKPIPLRARAEAAPAWHKHDLPRPVVGFVIRTGQTEGHRPRATSG